MCRCLCSADNRNLDKTDKDLASQLRQTGQRSLLFNTAPLSCLACPSLSPATFSISVSNPYAMSLAYHSPPQSPLSCNQRIGKTRRDAARLFSVRLRTTRTPPSVSSVSADQQRSHAHTRTAEFQHAIVSQKNSNQTAVSKRKPKLCKQNPNGKREQRCCAGKQAANGGRSPFSGLKMYIPNEGNAQT